MKLLAASPRPAPAWWAAAPGARPPASRNGGLVVLLTCVALAGGVVTASAMSEARVAAVMQGFERDEDLPKTPVYYAAHALQLLAMLSAGTLAFLTRDRRLPLVYDLRMAALIGAGALMSVRGMTLGEFFTSRVVGSTGPLVAVVSLLVFAGAADPRFRRFAHVLDAFAVLMSVAVLQQLAGVRSTERTEVVAQLGNYVDLLYWPAAWMILKPSLGASTAQRVFRWLPVAVFTIASVFTQTRLNFVMLALLFAAFGYVEVRRGVAAAQNLVALTVLFLFIVIAASWGSGTRFAGLADQSAVAFRERLLHDSRTHQIVSFFADVAPHELVLGRGSRATWNWPGMSPRWAGGTDIGYLSLLFYGGIPLLFTWLLVHVAPAVNVLRSRAAKGVELTAALIVMLYAVRMFSSTFPRLAPEYYAVLLCVGACMQWRAEPAPRVGGPRWRVPCASSGSRTSPCPPSTVTTGPRPAAPGTG